MCVCNLQHSTGALTRVERHWACNRRAQSLRAPQTLSPRGARERSFAPTVTLLHCLNAYEHTRARVAVPLFAHDRTIIHQRGVFGWWTCAVHFEHASCECCAVRTSLYDWRSVALRTFEVFNLRTRFSGKKKRLADNSSTKYQYC